MAELADQSKDVAGLRDGEACVDEALQNALDGLESSDTAGGQTKIGDEFAECDGGVTKGHGVAAQDVPPVAACGHIDAIQLHGKCVDGNQLAQRFPIAHVIVEGFGGVHAQDVGDRLHGQLIERQRAGCGHNPLAGDLSWPPAPAGCR